METPSNEQDTPGSVNEGSRREAAPPSEESQEISQVDVDALMKAAAPVDSEASSADAPAAASPPPTEPFTLPDLGEAATPEVDAKRMTMLNDVNLRVRIELGRTRMLVEDVLKLGKGSVVELDKLAGDPVDVFVNDRLIARGEVLVLNDNFCVRINEVLSRDPHRVSA